MVALRNLPILLAKVPGSTSTKTRHFEKGNFLFEQGEFEAAISEYDRALADSVQSAAVWTNRGAALSHLGYLEEALKNHEQALELSPTDPVVLNNKGVTLGLLGKHDEALAAFRTAHSLAGSNEGLLLYNIGHSYQHLGDYGRAAEFYRSSARSDSSDPRVYFNLALVLLKLGESEDALQAVALAIDLDPGNEASLDLRRLVLQGHLRKLARRGFASWSGGKPKGSNPRIPITPGPPVSDYVIEDRQ